MSANSRCAPCRLPHRNAGGGPTQRGKTSLPSPAAPWGSVGRDPRRVPPARLLPSSTSAPREPQPYANPNSTRAPTPRVSRSHACPDPTRVPTPREAQPEPSPARPPPPPQPLPCRRRGSSAGRCRCSPWSPPPGREPVQPRGAELCIPRREVFRCPVGPGWNRDRDRDGTGRAAAAGRQKKKKKKN